MVNYHNSKVFTIRNRVNEKKFVSFTTKRLCEVFNNYKQKFKRGTADNVLMQAFNEIGIENFYIVLEEEIEASNKDVVNERLHHFMNHYDTIKNGYNYVRSHKNQIKPKQAQTLSPVINEVIPEVITPTLSPDIPEVITSNDDFLRKMIKKYRMPKGVYVTDISFLNSEFPTNRLIAYRVMCKQILDNEISASPEVIRVLSKYNKN
jgi:hypothetical protein